MHIPTEYFVACSDAAACVHSGRQMFDDAVSVPGQGVDHDPGLDLLQEVLIRHLRPGPGPRSSSRPVTGNVLQVGDLTQNLLSWTHAGQLKNIAQEWAELAEFWTADPVPDVLDVLTGLVYVAQQAESAHEHLYCATRTSEELEPVGQSASLTAHSPDAYDGCAVMLL